MNTFLLLIIGIPAVEIYLFIKIGSQIGAFNTILLIFITAFFGVIYARYEGFNTLKSGMSQIVKNELPAYEIISGAAIAFAALLLIIPGFATDFLGFLLIFPITRKLIFGNLSKKLKKQKEFIYFPSLSAGGFASNLIKDTKLSNGTTCRFYDDSYPEEFRHKAFLITAGHYYKKMDIRDQFGLGKDTLVFGDSGGYQIATGALKYTDDLREKIFHWLEANSDVAANLDIPPKTVYENNETPFKNTIPRASCNSLSKAPSMKTLSQ